MISLNTASVLIQQIKFDEFSRQEYCLNTASVLIQQEIGDTAVKTYCLNTASVLIQLSVEQQREKDSISLNTASVLIQLFNRFALSGRR